jgi:hypothetical protein
MRGAYRSTAPTRVNPGLIEFRSDCIAEETLMAVVTVREACSRKP